MNALAAEAGFPLSAQQRRLWALGADHPRLCTQSVFELEGPLAAAPFAAALARAAARHEALRTVFRLLPSLTEPLQVITDEVPLRLSFQDLEGLAAAAREGEVRRLLDAEREGPFELARGPLLAAVLVRTAPLRHLLLLTSPALVADAASHANLVAGLAAEYAGLALPEEPLQYVDYAGWQAELFAAEEALPLAERWRQRLAAAPPALAVPAFAAGEGEGVAHLRCIPLPHAPALGAALAHRLAAGEESLAAFLLAGWVAFLWRFHGDSALLVGRLDPGRKYQDLATACGPFALALPLRFRPSAELTVTELIALAAEGQGEALAEAEYFAADRAAELLYGFELSRLPPPLAAGELRLTALSASGEVELTALRLRARISAAGTGEPGLELACDGRLFGECEATRLAGQLAALLTDAAAHPGKRLCALELFTAEDRARVLTAWNNTALPLPEQTPFPLLFHRQAERTPERVALSSGDEALSYGELARRVDAGAWQLRRAGAGLEERVVITLPRSPAQVEAILATLAAGAAFVPVAADQPPARLRLMLEEVWQPGGRRLLIAAPQAELPAMPALERFSLDRDETSTPAPPALEIPRAALAYILFTSGSTGRPKGTMVHHGAVSNLFYALGRAVYADAGDALRISLNAPLVFDAAIKQLIQLAAGHCLELVPEELRPDGAGLEAFLTARAVSVLDTTPTQLRLLLAAGALSARSTGLERLLIGGEAIDPPLWRTLSAAPARCFNVYGPTECTVDTTAAAITPESRQPHLGGPLANVRCYVVDAWGRALPEGHAGELLIGGAGVARGYARRPGLTTERFVPDPFGTAGERLYRSGDRVRWRPDGNLEYLGRLDQQIKVRGMRIELGEIESVLASHPAVAQAAAVLRPPAAAGEGSEAQLVAFVVAGPGAAGAAELREFVRQHLPEALVPAAVTLVERLPLTRNGKLDRARLAELTPNADEAPPRRKPASTPFEAMLVELFAEVLGLATVGVDESFFELGGHSLLATELAVRVAKTFRTDLPLRAIFEAPTIAELARRLELELATGAGSALPAIAREDGEGPAPLSYAQRRLWILDRLEPGNPLYNLVRAVALEGELDLEALAACLAAMVARHAVLRTRLVEGEPEAMQVIDPPRAVAIPVVDLSGLGTAAQEGLLASRALTFARRPFALGSEALLRAAAWRCAESSSALFVAVHHAVFDGFSVGIFFRELSALYAARRAGRDAALPALPFQYADYARWQRRHLDDAALARELAFWRAELAGELPVLELPADRPRPAAPTYRGGVARRLLAPAALLPLRRLARARGATLFMVTLTAYALLLARRAGTAEIVIGVPIANRNREGLATLVGFFVNTLALRFSWAASDRAADVLDRVVTTALRAYGHQDLPFERLIEDQNPSRRLAQSPIFQVMFSLLNTPPGELELPGVRFGRALYRGHAAACDLAANLAEGPEGLVCLLEYSTDLFDATTAERLWGEYQTLLLALAGDPERPVRDLPLLRREEVHQLVVEWNTEGASAALAGPSLLHEFFFASAAQRPQATAVVCGAEHLSYGAAAELAHCLAHHLAALGIGPEVVVGVAVERSPELIWGLLGVLAAGGCCLPLDPGQPRERLTYFLADSQARVLLSLARLRPLLPAQDALLCLDQLPPPALAAGSGNGAGLDALHPAYAIFTSGSTGKPKAALLCHGALASYVRHITPRLALAASDRFLQFAALSFDVVIEELFPAFAAGATVVLPERDLLTAPPAELEELLLGEAITHCELPAAYWHAWMAELAHAGRRPPPLLSRLLVGCEKPEAGALARWRSFEVPLLVVFGLTETSITNTLCLVPGATAAPGFGLDLPIGRPLANSPILVVDRALRPQPIGVPGELLIGGEGLARGYRGRPGLSAARFVPDPGAPGAGARTYRTGDRARWRADGNLEFLGRLDHQINLRGLRIEPGEIEAALQRHAAVAAAAVVLRPTPNGASALVAFWVRAAGAAAAAEATSGAALRRFLAASLPEGLLPAAFVELAALPLTAHGKTDRRALPAPDWSRSAAVELPTTGGTELAALVTGLAAGVLGLPRVAPSDDFFALGGHSLLATQLLARLRRELAVEVPLRRLFEHPRLSALIAAVADARARQVGLVRPPLSRVPASASAPLSYAQQRLFFMSHLDGESPAYSLPAAFHLRGALAPALVRRVLSEVVRRHEVLRTVFVWQDGRAWQRVLPAAPAALPLVDLSGLATGDATRLALALARREALSPFDLERGPLLRAHLLRLEAEHHALLFNQHHLASDGWSTAVLVREVSALYAAFARGAASPLAEPPIQYRDYAAWQRSWLQGETLAAEIEFWRRRLGPDLPALRLPSDRPRPAVRSGRGANHLLTLPASLSGALDELARREGVTLFMVLLAAFDLLLLAATGQEELVVGTDVANRGAAECEELIGFFVNQLVLRCDLRGDPTFRELLVRLREVTLAAYDHQDLPFDELVRALAPARDLGRHPLFQHKLVLQNAALPELELGGLALEPLVFDRGVAKFDLLLDLAAVGGTLAGRIEYSTDLFDATTITRLAERFVALLEIAIGRVEAPLSEILAELEEENARQLARASHSRLRALPRAAAVRVEVNS